MVFNSKVILALNVPYQESLVVGFSMVLLYGASGVPNAAGLVKNLAAMDVAEHQLEQVKSELGKVTTLLEQQRKPLG